MSSSSFGPQQYQQPRPFPPQPQYQQPQPFGQAQGSWEDQPFGAPQPAQNPMPSPNAIPAQDPAPAPIPAGLQPRPFPSGTNPDGSRRSSAKQPADPRKPLYGANPGNAFVRFFSKYAVFSGRASRSEYWWMKFWGAVCSWIIPPLCAFAALLIALPLTSINSDDYGQWGPAIASAETIGLTLLVVAFIVWIVLLIPSLALRMRRLHDANLSGGWSAFWLVALILRDIVCLGAAGGILCYAVLASAPRAQARMILDGLYGIDANGIWNSVSHWDASTLAANSAFITALTVLIVATIVCGLAVLAFDLVVGLLPTRPAGTRFDRTEGKACAKKDSAPTDDDPADDDPINDNPTAEDPTADATAETAGTAEEPENTTEN